MEFWRGSVRNNLARDWEQNSDTWNYMITNGVTIKYSAGAASARDLTSSAVKEMVPERMRGLRRLGAATFLKSLLMYGCIEDGWQSRSPAT